MPISLADLQNHRATVQVDTPLGPVAVTYRPNALTPAKEAEMSALARIGDEDEDADIRDHSMIRMFCELVESIDLAGPVIDEEGTQIVGPGELIPVEPEYVVYIPSPILMATFVAIRSQTEEEAERQSKSSRSGARIERIDSRRGSLGRRDR